MAFIPPGFPILRVSTLNLDTNFTLLLDRFQISQPAAGNDPKQPTQNSLDVLIARILALKESKTARTAANDVLETLANEYAPYSKSHTPAECKKATLFLLGAMIHRYFRIIKEYDYTNSYTSYLFKTCDEKNCRLFKALRKALNLEFTAKDKFPEKYRVKDLERLDAATIVTALRSFRDNMTKPDGNKKPRYMQYPHFAAPTTHFEAYLKEIIDEHEPRALPVLQQYKAIDFIQSLASFCEKEYKEVETALAAWKVTLKRDHAKFESLSFEKLEAHIIANVNPKIKEDPIREKILDLLYTPNIKDKLATPDKLAALNHETFHAHMLETHLGRNNQALLGGYVLLLESKSVVKLKACIYKALNIELKPSSLTDEDQLRAVTMMEDFLKANPKAELDYEFFGSKEKFGNQVAVAREAIGKRAAAKVEDNKAAAAPAPAFA